MVMTLKLSKIRVISAMFLSAVVNPIDTGAHVAYSQNAILSPVQDPSSSKDDGSDLKGAEMLAKSVVDAANWRLDEFTPENVEKAFGVTLQPVKSEKGGRMGWKSTGPLHVSLFTHGPIIRFLTVNWGSVPNKSVERQQPKICVRNKDISENILSREWAFYSQNSDAPLGNIVTFSHNVTETYRRIDYNKDLRSINFSYASASFHTIYCIFQFEISIVPPPRF
jgi:hypothetical protein